MTSTQQAVLLSISADALEIGDKHINSCCAFLLGAAGWPGQYDGLTVESCVRDLRLLVRAKMIEMDRAKPAALAPVRTPTPVVAPAPAPKARPLDLGGIVLTLDPWSPRRR